MKLRKVLFMPIVTIFLMGTPACTSWTSGLKSEEVKLPPLCDKEFVPPAPPTLPPIPVLTPEDLTDRKRSEAILVAHIAVLRKQTTLYFMRVEAASARYRRLCKKA